MSASRARIHSHQAGICAQGEFRFSTETPLIDSRIQRGIVVPARHKLEEETAGS